jgi:hypothetical protein
MATTSSRPVSISGRGAIDPSLGWLELLKGSHPPLLDATQKLSLKNPPKRIIVKSVRDIIMPRSCALDFGLLSKN